MIRSKEIAALCRGLIFAASLGLGATAYSAGSITYPDQGPVPPGIRFFNISESSATDSVPLYGPPTAFSVGLDFKPSGFGAFGTNGASDITDGQLNFSVEGQSNVGIGSISFSESGDYTLVGAGTPASQVFAGAIVRIEVTQIDGVDVAPILLSPFNASVNFNLVANPGVVAAWSLGLSMDINAALTAMGMQFDLGATKIDAVIDNQLDALSESGSIAAIMKKNFDVEVTPNVAPIPEPGTMALLFSSGLAGLLIFRRSKR